MIKELKINENTASSAPNGSVPVVVDNTVDINLPTVIITFGENNMPVVELKNWGGINAMMIERATYEIHRASHQHRANELHKQNVEKQNIENLKGEQNV